MRLTNHCLLACTCVMLFGLPVHAKELEQTDVFISGEDDYKAYRIPAMVQTTKGTLLAFAEGRVNGLSDNGNIDTVLKRSTDGGKTWSKLTVISDMGTDAICNPCPVVDMSNGRIWLPLTWKAGENNGTQNKRGTGRGTMEVFMLYSDDDGVTWSKPENITSQVKREDWTWYVVGPGNGIQLKSGRLVLPCDHRKKSEQNDKASFSNVIYSDDHGKTWQIGGELERKTNECQVAELANGDLLMTIRSHDSPEKLRSFSTSKDQGLTWSPVRFAEGVPDPTCQASILRLPATSGDNALIFSNPDSNKRERMTVRISEDGGETWSSGRVLHEGPSGYSSLATVSKGRAGCVYEQGGGKGKELQKIVFAAFDIEGLKKVR